MTLTSALRANGRAALQPLAVYTQPEEDNCQEKYRYVVLSFNTLSEDCFYSGGEIDTARFNANQRQRVSEMLATYISGNA